MEESAHQAVIQGTLPVQAIHTTNLDIEQLRDHEGRLTRVHKLERIHPVRRFARRRMRNLGTFHACTSLRRFSVGSALMDCLTFCWASLRSWPRRSVRRLEANPPLIELTQRFISKTPRRQYRKASKPQRALNDCRQRRFAEWLAHTSTSGLRFKRPHAKPCAIIASKPQGTFR